MKVYALPAEMPAPEIKLDDRAWERKEAEHRQRFTQWLKENGYPGPNTGKSLRFGVADGRAEYLYADNGAKSCLFHMPYGDAYQYPDVRFLPRKEVLRRIEQDEAFTKRWAELAKENAEQQQRTDSPKGGRWAAQANESERKERK